MGTTASPSLRHLRVILERASSELVLSAASLVLGAADVALGAADLVPRAENLV